MQAKRAGIEIQMSDESTTERHFTPESLAELWALSPDSIRRLFEKEPGVLVVTRNGNRTRRYRTLRIPQSVADRVHRRLTNPITGPVRKIS